LWGILNESSGKISSAPKDFERLVQVSSGIEGFPIGDEESIP